MTASNYAASYVQIFPAMKTGRVQVIANAMARELITDATGKVTAVSYIDKTRRHRAAGPLPDGRARGERVRVGAPAAQLEVVAPSAGAGQLLGQGRPLPDGHRRLEHVGDGAGALGHAALQLGRLRLAPLRAVVGLGQAQELGFPRGYHIEVGGGYGMPGIGSFTGIVNRTEGYGVEMKQAIRDEYGTSIGLSGRGEMIPNEQSFCEIDPEVKDRWGIPVLRFHWEWSDHELNQVRHMQTTFRAILEGMGGQIATGGGRGGGRRRGRRPTAGRAAAASRAAAPSSTKSARCAWATTRRRARSTSSARRTR